MVLFPHQHIFQLWVAIWSLSCTPTPLLTIFNISCMTSIRKSIVYIHKKINSPLKKEENTWNWHCLQNKFMCHLFLYIVFKILRWKSYNTKIVWWKKIQYQIGWGNVLYHRIYMKITQRECITWMKHIFWPYLINLFSSNVQNTSHDKKPM